VAPSTSSELEAVGFVRRSAGRIRLKPPDDI
jgi:hypothetical protein